MVRHQLQQQQQMTQTWRANDSAMGGVRHSHVLLASVISLWQSGSSMCIVAVTAPAGGACLLPRMGMSWRRCCHVLDCCVIEHVPRHKLVPSRADAPAGIAIARCLCSPPYRGSSSSVVNYGSWRRLMHGTAGCCPGQLVPCTSCC